MPRTKATLDSLPVELPSRNQRPLKRTHTSTSLGSLPTPPQTRKRKRSRSRHSRATDSGSEFDFQDSDDEALETGRVRHSRNVVVVEHNKRKLLRVDAIAAELSGQAEEDAFWMSESSAAELASSKLKGKAVAEDPSMVDSPAANTRSRTRSPSSSPALMLNRARMGLLSPPKSHRRRSPRMPKMAPMSTITEEDPLTPQPKSALDSVRKRLFPERDSPNNPFLVSEESSPIAGASSTQLPRTPKKHIERRTLTYVFRGVRQEFENPLYDPRYPDTGVAPEGGSNSPSNLPPEHPDFSPKEHCPPRILFPEARARRRCTVEISGADEVAVPQTPSKVKGRPRGKKARVQLEPQRKKSEWDTSDEDEPKSPTTPRVKAPVTPVRARAPDVAAVKPPSHRRTTTKAVEPAVGVPQTRSRTRVGLKVAPVMPEKDKSDPARRAFGPRVRGK